MPSALITLSEVEADAFREMANIGTGHAVTSLATLTGQVFTMSVPSFGVVAMSEFYEVVADAEAVSAAVYMPVGGDAPGHVAFLFPYASACRLLDRILGRENGETQTFDEMECSALMEVGNILVSSFLNAIADLTGLSMPASPPGIAIDMSGAILSSIAAASPNLGDHALTVMTRLTDCEQPIEGAFVYIPEPTSLTAVFKSLGMDS